MFANEKFYIINPAKIGSIFGKFCIFEIHGMDDCCKSKNKMWTYLPKDREHKKSMGKICTIYLAKKACYTV